MVKSKQVGFLKRDDTNFEMAPQHSNLDKLIDRLLPYNRLRMIPSTF